MKILVVNAGSSSLKYQLIDMSNETVLCKGNCERIGTDGKYTHKVPGREPEKQAYSLPTHNEAIKLVLSLLTDPQKGVIKSVEVIDAVGHRIAHGGEKYRNSTVINNEVLQYLEGIVPINPLHGPPAIAGIRACMAQMPGKLQVGVFDTGFYGDIPDYRYIYPLPLKYYTEQKIRRYGFHGTSHRYVTARAAELVGKDLNSLKIITCHLGNGSSVTATQGGKAIDTSMGFTPQEGVVMGTRSGSFDPTVLTYIMKQEGLTPDQAEDLINKKSGLLGLTGISNDAYDIQKAAAAGNETARLAQKIVANSVKKLIGSYFAELNGLDVLVFTAGIGEFDEDIRRLTCSNLEALGIKIDLEKNDHAPRGEEFELTAPGAKVRTFIIPTNEELMIARDTAALIK